MHDCQLAVWINSQWFISAGKLKSDCSDLRFTGPDKTTAIPHWIEHGCNQRATKIWVKIPEVPANQLSHIYMVYGDPDAEDTADADAVFEFFDHFEGDFLNPEKWTIERNDNLTNYVDGSHFNIRAIRTGVYDGRFIVNSNYTFNKNVEIEYKIKTGFYIITQIGHLVQAGGMMVNTPSGLQWTTQSWYTEMYERYSHDDKGAKGCEVSTRGCYPGGDYLPVGDGWVDKSGQRYGPKSDTFGIGVLDISGGDNAYYENWFAIDWVRIRAYYPQTPSFYVNAEEPFTGEIVVPVPNVCSALQLELDLKNAEIAQKDALIDSLNQTINDMQATIDSLNQQVSDLHNEVAELSDENTSLTQQLDQLNTDLAAEIRRIETGLGISIPGDTSVEQLDDLFDAILGMNRGRQMGIIEQY